MLIIMLGLYAAGMQSLGFAAVVVLSVTIPTIAMRPQWKIHNHSNATAEQVNLLHHLTWMTLIWGIQTITVSPWWTHTFIASLLCHHNYGSDCWPTPENKKCAPFKPLWCSKNKRLRSIMMPMAFLLTFPVESLAKCSLTAIIHQ